MSDNITNEEFKEWSQSKGTKYILETLYQWLKVYRKNLPTFYKDDAEMKMQSGRILELEKNIHYIRGKGLSND